VLWATGPKHFEGVGVALAQAGSPAWVHALPYIEDMPSALAAADLAVSRAGAMAAAELVNQGLPALLVPLPTAAEDHQTHNARALAEAGAAVLLPQSELSAETLAHRLRSLLSDPATLERMRHAASERARPEARARIAADIASWLPPPGGAA
jgi:UDP-N-acetylglucosamine--N-acetylmuramyl-(pentapeptide) pyrophosphoryl-undecaprenol N-acetylglucosamine transferase